MEDFAQTYRGYSIDDLAALHGQVDSLTDEARWALLSEVQRRGLSESALHGLRDARTERAARVDQEWREERNDDAARMLKRFAMRVGFVIAGAIVAGLIALLRSSH
jgi:hypothetical protein